MSLCPAGAVNARRRGLGIPCSGGFSHAILPVSASTCFHLACTRPFSTLVSRNRLATSPAFRSVRRVSASGWSTSARTFLLVLVRFNPADLNAQSACSGVAQLNSDFLPSGIFLFLVFLSTKLAGAG